MAGGLFVLETHLPEHDTLTREQYMKLRDFPPTKKVKVRRVGVRKATKK